MRGVMPVEVGRVNVHDHVAELRDGVQHRMAHSLGNRVGFSQRDIGHRHDAHLGHDTVPEPAGANL